MTFNFTTIVGVDQEHLEELRLVWPTWRLHRPELLSHPLLLVCDGARPLSAWQKDLAFLGHPQSEILLWNLADAEQREKMLNGLVFAAARQITTPWYLKLDTDTIALRSAEWIDLSWFLPDDKGQFPSLISCPWGYTKPADAIERLDAWGDTHPQLASFPRLNLSPRPGAELVVHPRIIGWCFFGRTEATQGAAALCAERLPVPSQDTFLWYVAKRRGELIRRIPMKRYGWDHVSGCRRLRRLCDYALGRPGRHLVPSPNAPHGSRDRRGPSPVVADALAQALATLVPGEGKGILVEAIGQATATALQRQRPDWSFRSISFGSHGSLPETGVSEGHTVDFVILEAATEFESVSRLLQEWWPKLRPGGILAGINHGHPRDRRGLWGVSRAVTAFASKVDVPVVLPGQTVWLLHKPVRTVLSHSGWSAVKNVQASDRSAYGKELAVVTCFFNPARDERLACNFDRCKRALAEQKIKLWTVEVAFGTLPFSLAPEDHLLQLRGSSRLWQKERALNVLISGLPSTVDKVAWIDADVIFENDAWSVELCRRLDEFPIAQCWSHGEFLDDAGQSEEFRDSSARVVTDSHPDQQSFATGHPGLAWGARRELLSEQGLYDRHVTGGGDSLMALATFGWWEHRLLQRLTTASRNHFLLWGRQWYSEVAGRVGVVEGCVRHLWHGSLENRRYLERWDWLRQHDFDPTLDLQLDEQGLWRWASHKPELHGQIESYFEWLKTEGHSDKSARAPDSSALCSGS